MSTLMALDFTGRDVLIVSFAVCFQVAAFTLTAQIEA